MNKSLLSVGIDVGTTTTQVVFSRLAVRDQGSAFSVPEVQIIERALVYKGNVHFTPLSGHDRVDGEAIRALITAEYARAGIAREQVDTGAIIITGETGRKENARTVLHSLSEFAGDFVVATAGPHLESVLAAKGAGADRFSEETGKTVLHIDIGGGTSNFALIRKGEIVETGCMNVGGRLVKCDERGKIAYRSPVLVGLFPYDVGQTPPTRAWEHLCDELARALAQAAGFLPTDDLLSTLWTAEAGVPWEIPADVEIVSFSGGVAECIDREVAPFAFGDIGAMLGQAIRRGELCRRAYRVCGESIRSTVIGAGSHSTQLSGSTVFVRNIDFPLKNLPVVSVCTQEQSTFCDTVRQKMRLQETLSVLFLPDFAPAHYADITATADAIADALPHGAVLVAMESDAAKALGHALALRLAPERPVLCIDRVRLSDSTYLDVGAPVASALPVVIKTLILEK